MKRERYYLDLFSGIGGFALGAYWAGLRFDKHYFSEIEPYAIELYQKRFPEAEALGDIKNVCYSKLPRGEYLVTGGFPCQPHSISGKRQAENDKRDLWAECKRMLCELQPGMALFENVGGLLPLLEKSEKENFSIGFCRTFTKAGMLQNGRLYRLRTLGRRIKERGSGLLPTPTASDYRGGRTIQAGLRVGRKSNNNYRDFCRQILGWTYPSCKLTETIMGYPPGWTDLNASVTPLYLNVQK